MRNSIYSLAIVAVLILGATTAKADSQKFNEFGMGGAQTLTANSGVNFSNWTSTYSFTLSGATGSYSGSCGWFGTCQISAKFTDVIKGITYTETVLGQISFGQLQFNSNPQFVQASVQAPEESSFFELLAAGLLLALLLPMGAKLRRPLQA